MKGFEFYQGLPSIDSLRGIQDGRGFRECPDDWIIVISDVRGSTKAVADGRYREVNLCGVAVIALVQEQLGGRGFPFVFGGDGATLLLPPAAFEQLKPDLRRLISRVRSEFGLDLRVGAVPYLLIKKDGASIEVGRLKISPTNFLATLKGDGVALAEKLIKAGETYLLEALEASDLSLKKLSCRFSPIPSARDSILTLLVVPKDLQRFDGFMGEFESFLNDRRHRPLNDNMKMDSFWTVFNKERQMDKAPVFEIFKRILTVKIALLLAKLFPESGVAKLSNGYLADIPANSDYQKFDGALRTVIDCTKEERGRILSMLEKYEREGILVYGFSESKTALMTCVVDDIRGGEHIHFIDGGGGGYTAAAKSMKAKS